MEEYNFNVSDNFYISSKFLKIVENSGYLATHLIKILNSLSVRGFIKKTSTTDCKSWTEVMEVLGIDKTNNRKIKAMKKLLVDNDIIYEINNINGKKFKCNSELIRHNQLQFNTQIDKYDIIYGDYLLSDKWKNLRNEVLKRDSYKCTKCGSKDNLHIHHLTYDNLGNENLEDLITLCNTCHNKVHKSKSNETIKSSDINKMLSEDTLNMKMLYRYLRQTLNMSAWNTIKIYGDKTFPNFNNKIIEDVQITGYILKIMNNLHSFKNCVMNNKKYINSWEELFEIIECADNIIQRKLKDFFTNNDLYKITNEKFYINPFLYRNNDYVHIDTIKEFKNYLDVGKNIDHYTYIWINNN